MSFHSVPMGSLMIACFGLAVFGCARGDALDSPPDVYGMDAGAAGAKSTTANGGGATTPPTTAASSGGSAGAPSANAGSTGFWTPAGVPSSGNWGSGGTSTTPAGSGGESSTMGTGGAPVVPSETGGLATTTPPSASGGASPTDAAAPSTGTGGAASPPPPSTGRWCPGDPIAVVSTQPAATRKVKDLTGSQTSSGAFGVGGTDLGIPVRQPNGQIAYVFGDTFEQDGVGGPGWRAPVLLRSAASNLSSGINFTGAAGGSYAKQILAYDHSSADYSTWLPSDVITIGSRMYLHYIVNQGLGNVRWTQIAYSDDNGENWTISGARWDGGVNGGLRQLWTWEEGCDGYVYVLSTSFQRSDPIILHRVPTESILDPSKYEPWGYANGQWAWGQPPTPVLEGKFGELSLRRVEHKWVLSWFNAGDYEITVKVFDSPTSNLYEAATYHPIHGGSWPVQTDTSVPQLYGGYIHPDSTLHELTLIVSQWNTQTNWPYHAMQFVTGVAR